LHGHSEVRTVVELGAGDGRLLGDLAAARPDLRLHGVDLRARPISLPPHVGWVRDLFDVTTNAWRTSQVSDLIRQVGESVLVVCAEWLDDLPCAVAVRVEGDLRLLEVEARGRERVGTAPDPVDRAWALRWSPTAARLEIGTTRDRAWASICNLLRPHGGLALMIDYGHLRDERPARGTLAAYRHGDRVTPRPSAEVNLTAAVAVDSLADAGHRIGATTLLRARQHQVIPPPVADSADPLATLVARSQHAAATVPRIWGDHWWLLQQIPPGEHLDRDGSRAPVVD
jgi:hypothetical protein